MEKRYQVFVSSTYADLKEERSKVIQTIMELHCIPAGMELFPAIDQQQLEFIKKIIDDCDYYILIIGGRYGSLTEDGISFTEKEYDYAVQKGIKVLAFLHSDLNSIPLGKSEQDILLRKKLDAFRIKVSSGRLIKYWSTAEQLPSQVAISLSQTIVLSPTAGWVRGNFKIAKDYFQIVNKASDKVLDASLNDKTIHVYKPHNGDNQIWELRNQRLNLFSIHSKKTDKCLEVKNGSMDNAASIQLSDYNGSKYQLWEILSNPDGSYCIMTHADGKCLEADAQTVHKDGGRIIQHIYTGDDHQKWFIKLVIANTKFHQQTKMHEA